VVVSSGAILATGAMASRIPPRYLLRTGVGLLLIFALPFYRGLEARSINLTLALMLAGLAAGLTNGSFAVLLTDLFPTNVRFTGVALVFNVAFTVFSGLSPLVATTLIRESGQVVSPAYVMIASAVIALAGSLAVRRYGTGTLELT
jgi:MHS family proline/betaine transporter-like MFS transporter